MERERGEARRRIAADEERTLEEARGREVREFEMSSMGLEENGAGSGGQGRKRKADGDAMAAFKAREVEVDGKRKKVFELDEKEIARLAGEEQERLKEELKREKVVLFLVMLQSMRVLILMQSESTKSALRSFWLPSLTPTTDSNELAANKAVKLAPICPGSTDTNRHSYSLKSLVEVHFTEEKASDGTISRMCPSCKKNLTNGLKAIRTFLAPHIMSVLMSSGQTMRPCHLRSLRHQIHGSPWCTGSACLESRAGTHCRAAWPDTVLCLRSGYHAV